MKLDSVASSFEDYLLLDDGTDFHYIVVKGVFVQRFVFCDGAAVVDGLVGKEEQACDVGSAFHAEADEGEGAQFSG